MEDRQEMIRRARELRKNATPQERKLWYEFLRNHPARFRRQQPIGPYIVDFFCSSARLAVELDGGGHYEEEQMHYDRRRDDFLRSQNIQVLRFTNLDVQKEFSAVCETIDRAVTPEKEKIPRQGFTPSVSLAADSIPPPFVAARHFPLTGGIGPVKGEP